MERKEEVDMGEVGMEDMEEEGEGVLEGELLEASEVGEKGRTRMGRKETWRSEEDSQCVHCGQGMRQLNSLH